MWLPFLQILMSALLGTMTVMSTQSVPTLMQAFPAPVIEDTVVMESSVRVNIVHEQEKLPMFI